jgi:hypothetical protein
MAPSRFVEATITRLKKTRPSVVVFPSDSIRGSLFDGAAGIALFLHDAARRGDPTLMELADQWVAVAEAWAHDAREGDWSPGGGAPADCGNLLGRGGIAYVRILVSSALGDSRGVARGVDELARACSRVRDQARFPTALFDGAAGLLCAIRQVRCVVGGGLERDVVGLASALWPFLAEHLSRPIGGDDVYLGMAHGIAGELWAAATWARETDPLPDFVQARAAELVEVAARDVDIIVWPCVLGQPVFDHQVRTFCHGTTGHAVLWLALAARGAAHARRVVERLASTMCLLGPASSPILCCGLAGQALVHRALCGWAPRDLHLRRARARMSRATSIWQGYVRKPEALDFWQGGLGVATTALRLAAGDATIPCLELPRALLA